MTPLLICAVLGNRFPVQPVLDEVEAGRSLAKSVAVTDLEKRAGLIPGSARLKEIEHVYEPFQHPLGTWSDGGRKLVVEWALEITPELTSRWLGYLAERELWDADELGKRWESVQQKVGDRRMFVVVLSAYPTQPRYFIGEEQMQSPVETREVIFQFETSMGLVRPSAMMVLSRQTKSKSEMEEVPWWSATPFKQEFSSAFEGDYCPPVIERGNYYRSWWLVYSDADMGSQPVTLKIASARKIRSTVFD